MTASPALACAPPPPVEPRGGESQAQAERRLALETQQRMWDSAEEVYLARVAGIDESRAHTTTTFDLITPIKGHGRAAASMVSEQNRSCPTHAEPVQTLVILYALNNRSGQGRVGHVVPVAANADPRIAPLLRAAAERLRTSGQH